MDKKIVDIYTDLDIAVDVMALSTVGSNSASVSFIFHSRPLTFYQGYPCDKWL